MKFPAEGYSICTVVNYGEKIGSVVFTTTGLHAALGIIEDTLTMDNPSGNRVVSIGITEQPNKAPDEPQEEQGENS